MADVKLVLVDLLLDFLFDFVDSAVVLALQLCPGVAVVAEEALLGGAEQFFELAELHAQGLYHFLAVAQVLLYGRLFVQVFVLLLHLVVDFAMVFIVESF